ncbi:hypothetical protein CEUSTIGMA_g8674.t1 [Chlamydomonas eustigma]|uniref:Glycosyltransferase family 92 protein n=1 Tax=Chlamydomonas eustigma TaxID=1157962 RepID=A0A250XEA9_9CHLO|nr:hypothetical protein CEUSTIGMA_g8674.t1 [Chlamydomonas eustigma]|eukprot:GAX81242.1 hypothetical protein CEUSTIGMA_g8674.t1 [Chlamydomonas eustigma]
MYSVLLTTVVMIYGAATFFTTAALTTHPHAGFAELVHNYKDHKRVIIRPLPHFGMSPEQPPRPLVFLTSSFLDTRPISVDPNHGTAVLRMMILIQREPSLHNSKPESLGLAITEKQMDCVWFTSSGALHQTSVLRFQQPMSRPIDHPSYLEFMASCATNVTNSDLRSGLPGSGSHSIPRFATLVLKGFNVYDISMSAEGHEHWVHVNVVPLVANDARAVQEQYTARKQPTLNSSEDVFLTPEQYNSGQGLVASCSGTPLMTNGLYNGYFPQWLVYQKLIGVSKIFVYLGNPDHLEYWTLKHAEQHLGLIELYHFRLSHYLDDRNLVDNADRCGNLNSGPYHSAALHEGTSEANNSKWGKCLSLYALDIYWWGQLTGMSHCLYSAMGRYRWLLMHDYDEWFVPLFNPSAPVTVLELIHYWKKTAQGQDPVKYGQSNRTTAAAWPVSFMLQAAPVCIWCSGRGHPVLVPPIATSSTLPPDDGLNIIKVSMHMILSAVVRSPPKAVHDRSKNIIDPLAVLVMEVHEVCSTWKEEGGLHDETEASDITDAAVTSSHDYLSQMKTDHEGGLAAAAAHTALIPHIPKGDKMPYVPLPPDMVLMFHARSDGMFGRATKVWLKKQVESTGVDHNATNNGQDSDEILHLRSCETCDCGYCNVSEYEIVSDYSLANIYGQQLVAGVHNFLASFNLRAHQALLSNSTSPTYSNKS